MSPPFRAGERVSLRALEITDVPKLQGWVNDPEVTQYVLSGRRPVNAIREMEWIQKLYTNDEDVVFAIVKNDGGEHIGICGLHQMGPIDRFGVAGIIIGEPSLWGQGFGTEAMRLLIAHGFDVLNLHRIELAVYENNPRAMKSYTKLGFVEEGRLRQKRFKNGRWLDEVIMSILRTEWRT